MKRILILLLIVSCSPTKKFQETKEKWEKSVEDLNKLNFELYEIWTADDNDEIEVWKNININETVELKIISHEEDNNTSKIISELIDLWVELRAIREIFEEEDNQIYTKTITKSSIEIFNDNLKEMEDSWEDNNFKSLFKENVDPTLLTYLVLDDEIKSAITH